MTTTLDKYCTYWLSGGNSEYNRSPLMKNAIAIRRNGNQWIAIRGEFTPVQIAVGVTQLEALKKLEEAIAHV